MAEWFYDNTAFVSMLTSIATAFIWLIYLQVIVTSNSRQRRAIITINRGAGKNLDAHLVLCNLGYETVYVTDVIAEVDSGGERFAANITDCNDIPTDEPADPMTGTLQGPLGHGDCRALGTVRTLLDRIASENAFGDRDEAVGISIVVLAGRETSIGVRRRYRLIHEGGRTYLDADMMNTKRIPQKKARRYRKTWGYDVPKGYVDDEPKTRTVGASTTAS